MKSIVFTPTLNEMGNIQELIARIEAQSLEIDLLVVDDDSKDGTLEFLTELKKVKSNFHLIHRVGVSGIGGAHLCAMKFAIDGDYKYLVTLDADGSHEPEQLINFLEALKNSNIVIGSRYLDSSSLSDWKLSRRLLTRLVHLLTKVSLGLKEDTSSGYRGYQVESLKDADLNQIEASGYDFFFQSLFILKSQGLSVVEIPIHLPARAYGHSKMTVTLAFSALKTLSRMFINKAYRKVKNNEGK